MTFGWRFDGQAPPALLEKSGAGEITRKMRVPRARPSRALRSLLYDIRQVNGSLFRFALDLDRGFARFFIDRYHGGFDC